MTVSVVSAICTATDAVCSQKRANRSHSCCSLQDHLCRGRSNQLLHSTFKSKTMTAATLILLLCCLFLPTSSSLPTTLTTAQTVEKETTENSSGAASRQPLSLLSPFFVDLADFEDNPKLLADRSSMIRDYHRRSHLTGANRRNLDNNEDEEDVQNDQDDIKSGPMAKVGGTLTALYNIKMEEEKQNSGEVASSEAPPDTGDNSTTDDARRILTSTSIIESVASGLGVKVHNGRIYVNIVIDTPGDVTDAVSLQVLSELEEIGFEINGKYRRNFSGSISIDQIRNLASIENIRFARPVLAQNQGRRHRTRWHKQAKSAKSAKSGKKLDNKSRGGGKKSSKSETQMTWNHGPRSRCSHGSDNNNYDGEDDNEGGFCEPPSGLLTTQGDAAMKSNTARRDFNVRGKNVVIGVISNSFGCSAAGVILDTENGELPPEGVYVLGDDCAEGNNDEGRAMSQIVHDVAPGAIIGFHPGLQGEAEFAEGIVSLAQNLGADIIVDDVIHFTEPMFTDGIIAQAVNDASQQYGVSYFSASGNLGVSSYETGPEGFVASPSTDAYEFDGDTGDTRQTIVVEPGLTTLVLQWDQPYFSAGSMDGSASDLDINVYVGGILVLQSANVNIGGDPIEVLPIDNSASTPQEIEIEIILFDGPAPTFMKYVVFGPKPIIAEYDTKSSTSYGHANTLNAISVGAAYWRDTPTFGTSPAIHRDFSALAGTPIFMDPMGNRFDEPLIYQQPSVVGPDGVSTSVEGFDVFDGTSAAAPHVAALAALMLEANPSLTPNAVRDILETTAEDMDDQTTPNFDSGFDFTTGFGYVDAVLAVDRAFEY